MFGSFTMTLTHSRYSIGEWDSYFRDIGLPDDLRAAYMGYAIPLMQKSLPVIFNFDHLCLLLGKSPQHIASVINSPSSHYRRFSIAKRSGGRREILAPYPSLLECQQWVLRNILEKLSVDNAAHGFVKGKSIVTNAEGHLGKRDVIKIDIKDFFPSIPSKAVFLLFHSLGYIPEICWYLHQLCTLEGKLPQGAATSPALSNIYCRRLDRRLVGYCRRRGIKYSRYADDITLSSKSLKNRDLKFAIFAIKEENFSPNLKKIRFLRKGQRKIITGIDVTENRLRIPREYKRTIEKEVYYIIKFGIFSHIKKEKINNPSYLSSLFSRIRYWQYIETYNQKPAKLETRLRDYLSGSQNTH